MVNQPYSLWITIVEIWCDSIKNEISFIFSQLIISSEKMNECVMIHITNFATLPNASKICAIAFTLCGLRIAFKGCRPSRLR